MQKLRIFTIRDIKGDYYNPPFFARSHGEAERNFSQLSMDPKSTVSQFPEDYQLFYLGEYDDQTASITTKGLPELVMSASQVQQKT